MPPPIDTTYPSLSGYPDLQERATNYTSWVEQNPDLAQQEREERVAMARYEEEERQRAFERQLRNESMLEESGFEKNMLRGMGDTLMQSAAADDQMKLIRDASRFLATRRLARDLESGTPLHEALARNSGAWMGSGAAESAINRIAEGQRPANLELGQMLETPVGTLLGRGSRNAPAFRATPAPQTLSPSGVLSSLQREFEAKQRRYIAARSAAPVDSETGRPVDNAETRELFGQLQDLGLQIEAARKQSVFTPTAGVVEPASAPASPSAQVAAPVAPAPQGVWTGTSPGQIAYYAGSASDLTNVAASAALAPISAPVATNVVRYVRDPKTGKLHRAQ